MKIHYPKNTPLVLKNTGDSQIKMCFEGGRELLDPNEEIKINGLEIEDRGGDMYPMLKILSLTKGRCRIKMWTDVKVQITFENQLKQTKAN